MVNTCNPVSITEIKNKEIYWHSIRCQLGAGSRHREDSVYDHVRSTECTQDHNIQMMNLKKKKKKLCLFQYPKTVTNKNFRNKIHATISFSSFSCPIFYIEINTIIQFFSVVVVYECEKWYITLKRWHIMCALEEAAEENTLIQERENNLLVKKLLNVKLLICTLNTSVVKMTMHHQVV